MTEARPTHRIAAAVVVAFALAVACSTPAGAQSLWLDRDRPNTIQLEILKPDPDGADDVSFGSSAWYVSGRVETSPAFHIVGEVPFANLSVEGNNAGGWVLGNPYLGVELGTTQSVLLTEIGVRVPLSSDDFFSSLIGLYSDTDRWPAWFSEVGCVRFGLHVRSHPSGEGLWVEGRLAPELVFTTEPELFSDSEVWASYGLALRCDRSQVRAGASLSGRAFLSGFGENFGGSTLHELDLMANFGDWKLRPGVSLTLPIDEDVSDTISAVYGLNFSYGF